jgi:hypothetical protein
MRLGQLALSLVVVAFISTTSNADDLPLPWETGLACPAPAPETGAVPEGPAQTPALVQQQALGTELLFGLPTGVRVQGALARQDNHSFLVEGFAGLYLLAPLIGGGGRFSYTPLCGKQNALVVSPGLDGYYLVNPFRDLFGGRAGAAVLGADLECLWFHDCTGRGGWEVGLDLGCLVGKGSDGWAGVPIISVIGGLRF